MSSQLETLFRLQEIDLGLLEKLREIESYEGLLAKRRKAMEACNGRIQELTGTRKQLVNERAIAERQVLERQDLLRQKRQRLQKVRTDRELRASEGEVHSLIEEIETAEEQLLELMARVEELEAKISTERAEYSDLEQADHRHVNEDAERIEQLRRDLADAKGGRDGVAAELEAPVRKRYDLIHQRRGGLAVVKVKDGCCAGCHMRVPPQTLIEIMKTAAVRLCPSCQRILFVSQPE